MDSLEIACRISKHDGLMISEHSEGAFIEISEGQELAGIVLNMPAAKLLSDWLVKFTENNNG